MAKNKKPAQAGFLLNTDVHTRIRHWLAEWVFLIQQPKIDKYSYKNTMTSFDIQMKSKRSKE